MDLKGVEVKKVSWTPAKLGKESEETQPPIVQITLQMEAVPQEVKQLLEFAQGGPTTWKVNSVKREFAVVT